MGKSSAQSVSSAPQPDTPRVLEEALGRQVKLLRQRQGLKVRDLAERAGISVALLSRIEHGSVSPSLSTIEQIAKALNVPFTSLFMQISQKVSAAHIPSGKGVEVIRAGTYAGQLYEHLGIPMDTHTQVEPYLITIEANAQPGNTFQHEGIEFLYILQGCMTYRHGENIHKLKKGDSLYFDARVLHGPVAYDKLPCKFLAIISYHRS